MPRKPSFSYAHTPDGWKVEIPATLSPSGKRERAFFGTRDRARGFAQEMEAKYRALGTNHVAIKPSLAEAALHAEKILAPTGASLVDAAQAYRKTWEAAHASRGFGEAVAEYLLSRSDLRDATLKSYCYTLQKVFAPLGGRTLSSITTVELGDLYINKGSTAARMHRANLGAFWRWASKAPRNWCRQEILDGLENRRASNDNDIKILNPEEVRALLTAAEQESHAAAAAYAIAIFGGVRMGELGKLTWTDVGKEHIEIGKAISKKHSRRLVPICPTLAAWLEEHRDNKSDDMSIVPPNWADVSKSVRRRAGWNVAARLLPPEILEIKPTRGGWPANACRHTCASVQVAIGTPLESLIFAFGHSGGHDLLRRHYVSRLTKNDAQEILLSLPTTYKLKT